MDGKDLTSTEAGLSLSFSCLHVSECPQLSVQDTELAQHLKAWPITTTLGCKWVECKFYLQLPMGTAAFIFDHAHAKSCDCSSPAAFPSFSTGCLLKDIFTFEGLTIERFGFWAPSFEFVNSAPPVTARERSNSQQHRAFKASWGKGLVIFKMRTLNWLVRDLLWKRSNIRVDRNVFFQRWFVWL